MLDHPDLVAIVDLLGEPALVLRRPGAAAPTTTILHANPLFLALVADDVTASMTGGSARALREVLGPRLGVEALLRAAGAGEEWSGTLETTLTAAVLRARGMPAPGSEDLYLVLLTALPQVAPSELVPLLVGLSRESFYTLEVDVDCRLQLTWGDPRLAQITGWPLPELLERGGLAGLVIPADRGELLRRNVRLLAGEPAAARYRLRCGDGSIKLVRDAARPVGVGDSGLVRRVLGTLTDLGADADDALMAMALRLARLAGAVGTAPVGLIDRRGRIRRTLGLATGPLATSVADATGTSLATLLPPPAVDYWLDRLDAAIEAGEPIAARLPWRMGEVVTEAEIRLAAIDDNLVVALFLPVAAAGQGESASPTGRALLSCLRDPFLLLDLDLRVREANAAFERLIGRDLVDLHGMPVEEALIAPSGRAIAAEALDRAMHRQEVVRCPALPCLVRGAERPLDLQLVPMPGADGRPQGLLIEAQRAAQASLPGEGEPWFNAILDSVADGIVTLDQGGTVTWLSRTAETILDYPREAAIGAPLSVLMNASIDQPAGTLERLVADQSGRSRPIELMVRRRSGEFVPIEVEATTSDVAGVWMRVLAVRDITIRRQTEETLKSLAYHDPLTGLPNRLLFQDRLTQSIERAKRAKQQFAVMQVDLARFKLINDSLGLEKGDQVLRGVAERLTGTLRASDTVARLGADEFLVLLLGVAGVEAAARVAQKLLESLQQSLPVNGTELTPEASIGIALYPHDGVEADQLLNNAGAALSRAKEHGRNHYQFHTDDMNVAAFERLMLETNLRKALEQGEFVVFYQPKVSLETGVVTGLEALVRWQSPDLGLVPPAEFIPRAEETGLIVPVGEWVLRTACAQVERWHRMGFPTLQLAVNLSARQFQHRDLVASIAQVVDATGIKPALLELELTESVVMRDPVDTAKRLHELRALGHRPIDR